MTQYAAATISAAARQSFLFPRQRFHIFYRTSADFLFSLR